MKSFEEARELLIWDGGETEVTLSSDRMLESLREAVSLEAREALAGLRRIHADRCRGEQP